MLNKIAENKYQFAVNVRESFTYELDFEGQTVIIEYYCKTDNYRYLKSYKFYDLVGLLLVQSTDYQEIARVIHQSIDIYLNSNVISGSTRRAFLNFKTELTAVYNNFGLAQMYLL